ncbi:MAG: RdgB/HAM1 family non-canonical purine NTP pyrophosphatase [Porticoccaceae bacterium]|nr:RdgB/HAM1 family non-canonical purine NTP pyrophosphatase [Porticoccaceae bacterium]MEA3299706.1 RdgB/HAM1 family non-canonical purine NTP pyrophosphatase [Pseudomonadota bacterium]HLS99734.1 RdgB/HAM1 family non-canonical purine NTP pyrophosphatase [Porticoccaceae bacterium]
MTNSRVVAVEKVVLASGNAGKLREFQYLLADRGIDVVAQSEFSVPDADETGLSFVENAILKARHAARLTGLPAIADDSGLEVDVLDGAPGIYSARFAGPNASDGDNNARLLELLKGVPAERRTARYQCSLVYMRHAADPTPLICQGSWEGVIGTKPKGSHGFGYDPLFFVREQGCTAAELPREVKNTLSHRARAMRQLLDKLARPQAL